MTSVPVFHMFLKVRLTSFTYPIIWTRSYHEPSLRPERNYYGFILDFIWRNGLFMVL